VKGTLVDFDDATRLLSGDSQLCARQILIEKKNGRDHITLRVYLRGDANFDSERERLQTAFKVATEVSIDTIEILPYQVLIQELRADSKLKEKRIVELREIQTPI